MKYEIETKKGKSARLYLSHHISLAIKHAKEVNGKLIDRETGEVIFNFCKEGKV
jgi:hypothetical protein